MIAKAELSRRPVRFFRAGDPLPQTESGPITPALERELNAFQRELDQTTNLGLIIIGGEDAPQITRLKMRFEGLKPLIDYPNPFANSPSPTAEDELIQRAVNVGAMIILRKNLAEQIRVLGTIFRKNPVVLRTQDLATRENVIRIAEIERQVKLEQAITHRRLLTSGLTGELEVPLEEVRILDIETINPLKEEPQTLALHFQFLIKAAFIENDMTSMDDSVEALANHPIMGRFPLFVANQAEIAAMVVNALMELHPKTIDKYMNKASGFVREALEKARPLAVIIHRLRERIYTGLFDPASADFPFLKEVLDRYQAGSKEAITGLFIAGVALQDSRPAKSYQKAVQFANQGLHADFFKGIAQTLKEMAAERRDSSDVLECVDDLPPLANDLPQNTSINQLGPLISRLRLTGGATEFTVDDDNLPPAFPFRAIEVSFTPNIHEFEVRLPLIDAKGREKKLIASFNTKLGEVGWSVVEELTDHPNWQTFLIKTAAEALTAKLNELEQRKGANKAAAAVRQPAGLPGYLRRGRPFENGDKAQQRLPSRNGASAARPQQEISAPDFRIRLPTGKGLRKLTKGLPSEDWQLIQSALTSGDGLSPISLPRDDRRIGATHLLRILGFRLFLRRINPSGTPAFVVVRIDKGN